MTNLIPPNSKKQIVRLYWVRVVSVWGLFWALALLISAILLYPTYLLVTGTAAAYAETAASVTERTDIYNDMVAELNKSNQEAKAIVRMSESPVLSGILQDIWGVNGQGIAIASINLVRQAGDIAPVALTGEASDRQALASFRDRLEALAYVEKVDLPIENLAGSQDISFTITVTVNSQNI